VGGRLINFHHPTLRLVSYLYPEETEESGHRRMYSSAVASLPFSVGVLPREQPPADRKLALPQSTAGHGRGAPTPSATQRRRRRSSRPITFPFSVGCVL